MRIDTYREAAARLLGIPTEDVTDAQRDQAKRIAWLRAYDSSDEELDAARVELLRSSRK